MRLRSAIRPEPIGDITIPSELGGKRVTCIGDQAFECCNRLTSVTIPQSVTSIGGYAFGGCSGLRNVVMPKRFKRRQNEIFADCSETLKVTYI